MRQIELSGYKPYTEVLAQRSPRGQHRKTYTIALPLHLIGTYLPIPDPEVPFPGNRRVNKRHANKFTDYWLENKTWVTPPLLIDTTTPLHEDFTVEFGAGDVEFGVLKLYQNSDRTFEILDGQHRILGWKIAGDRIADDLKAYRSRLQAAEENGNSDTAEHWKKKIQETQALQTRYEHEYVTVEILQGITEDGHKQAFNDIATNALGITKSVTVSFDRRSMINRIAIDAAEGVELLQDRVDWEKDRVAGKNENLLSGRNLADLVRHVAVGIAGRMTRRREAEMNENSVAKLAEKFFTVLVESFTSLQEIAGGSVTPLEVREREMTISPTVLRVLAGAFHECAVDLSDERHPSLSTEGVEQIQRLFRELDGTMSYPLDDRWIETGFFADEDSKTPLSRAQDLSGLTAKLTEWAKIGSPFREN
ncbi:DNA sulfur modification protein DndB [Micrococcus luteus]|uniref:DGQHR domain-containing protein n=1 Tax=Micrococcus luteus TaxID=1270 RepID=A0AAP3EX52_MICLU|nr:DNA sulfur modification protein DndB [Micrococcus sp. KRD128]MCV7583353.1 hypothetical protein [Micrococcus luteus]MCV7587988.1 hypothetical protein [Micrococcus luteus]MCV7629092.1 hypothetical protein [Micrococcus luteus]